jgi:hypothetical protein
VRVTLPVEMPARCSAITDESNAGINPCIYNDLQK